MKSRLILILFCIIVALAALLAGLRLVVFDTDYYIASFEANGIYERLPDADERAFNLVAYMKGGEELNSDYFNQMEIAHMADVKAIIGAMVELLYVCLAFFAVFVIRLGSRKNIKLMAQGFLYGGISSLGFIFLVSVSALNFDSFFTKFHNIFFSNNLWLMNPETDMLIVMLPKAFFQSAMIKVLLLAAVFSVALLLIGLVLRRKNVCP